MEALTPLLPVLVLVTAGATVVQLILLVSIFRAIQKQQQPKRLQPTAELQKELTQAQKSIRDTAAKIDTQLTEWYAQLQAATESQLAAALKTAQQTIATQVASTVSKQSNTVADSFATLLNELRNTASNQIHTLLEQTEKSIAEHKQAEITAISAAAQKAVQSTATKLLGQSLSISQQQQLAEQALEEALSTSEQPTNQ